MKLKINLGIYGTKSSSTGPGLTELYADQGTLLFAGLEMVESLENKNEFLVSSLSDKYLRNIWWLIK